MDIAIQAVRAKTGRSLEGLPQSNDEFLQDVAAARGVYADLETKGRGLTSEEVRPTRNCCMFIRGQASAVLAEMLRASAKLRRSLFAHCCCTCLCTTFCSVRTTCWAACARLVQHGMHMHIYLLVSEPHEGERCRGWRLFLLGHQRCGCLMASRCPFGTRENGLSHVFCFSMTGRQFLFSSYVYS